MSAVASFGRDLVERRLAPVAAALAIALIAIPALMLKSGPTPAPVKPAAAKTEGVPEVVGRPAPSTELRNGERRLVGKPKNLFGAR